MKVSLFTTCMVDALAPEVGVATVRLLRAAGCHVMVPRAQTCCGQPAWNAGFAVQAAEVARASLDALDASGADAVVVPAGSCATMMRTYWPQMFEEAGDSAAAARARDLAARTFELTEFLVTRELPAFALAEPVKVAYHHSCHMQRELGVKAQPEALLRRVDGCEVVHWPAAERCCGFGGTFAVKMPEISVAMADDKLASLEGIADVVVGADGSCLLHMRSRAMREGRGVAVRHIAEFLAGALPS